MKYINLINQIPELDKQRMINYIDEFGINKDYFIGLDTWLQPWSHSNQKLYRLLGEKLIYKIPFEYEIDKSELSQKLDNLMNNSSFVELYNEFVKKIFAEEDEDKDKEELIKVFHESKVKSFSYYRVLLDNKIDNPFKYKSIHKKQTLQISKGMKPIKAIQKTINYFDFILSEEDYKKLKSSFEDFRIAHSRIFNTKIIKGQLCFSIHPFDFMTMSDNSLNWTSCMNWRDDGCYRVGTIEMMNSNNVICCYLESDDIPFYFSLDEDNKREEFRWNNKKFRELAYVTKDIIMNGKSYPYKNKDIDDFIIKTLKDLAEKNLGWKYSFGPETYRDMDHFFSGRSVNIIRNKMAEGTTKKNSILFDTNGMYNDILNVSDCHNAPFKCYRNKVDKTKIYSLSGKAPCLCCNKSIIYPQIDNIKTNTTFIDYNDRYTNVGAVLCEDCQESFRCYYCKRNSRTKYKHQLKVAFFDGTTFEYSICDDCFKRKVHECPDCHKPMIITDHFGVAPYNKSINKTVSEIYQEDHYPSIKYYKTEVYNDFSYALEALYVCSNCLEKKLYQDDLDYKTMGYAYFKDNLKSLPYRVSNLKDYDVNNFDFSQVLKQSGYFSFSKWDQIRKLKEKNKK